MKLQHRFGCGEFHRAASWESIKAKVEQAVSDIETQPIIYPKRLRRVNVFGEVVRKNILTVAAYAAKNELNPLDFAL